MANVTLSQGITKDMPYEIRMTRDIRYFRPFAIGQSKNVHVTIFTSSGKKITVGGKGETYHLHNHM